MLYYIYNMKVKEIFMSLDMIITQMREFLAISIPFTAVAFTLFFVLYKFILKKNMKTWKIIPGFLFVLNILLIIYLTCLTRSENYGEIDFHLFRSYYEAWNTFSVRNWQLIIFNIAVFCPMGTLLPILSEKFRSIIKTTGTGFLFSLAIEITQRVTQRGLCEIDDLFHNTLGVLLGYCGFRFFWTLLHKENFKPLRIIGSSMPFVLTICLFSHIFYSYEHQPYGNLPVNYTYQVDLSDTTLTLNEYLTLETEQKTVPIFTPKGCTKKDACLFASKLFDQMGIGGASRYSYYEDSIICYRGDHNITVYLKNCSYEYHYIQDENPVWDDIGIQVVKERLQLYGIEIPEEAVLTKPSKGVYQWTAERSINSSEKLSGTLTCITAADGSIYSITNEMISQTIYAKEEIMSETEAYDRLADGYFQISPHNLDIKNLTINNVSLTYSPDTKGYYQPVYLFHCEINGEYKDLVIPALKQ